MLASKSRVQVRSTSSPLALALTVTLCAQVLLAGPAQALSFLSAKKTQLQSPIEAKLDDDSIDATASGDSSVAEKVSLESESKSESKEAAKPPKKEEPRHGWGLRKIYSSDSDKDSKSSKSKKEVAKESDKSNEKTAGASAATDGTASLAPISLTGEKESPEQTDSGDGKQLMKLHAETMTVAPKGPLDGDGNGAGATLPSKSLKSEIGTGKGEAIDKARSVSVMPMALMNTDTEEDEKVITDLNAERAQIAELWESTLNRSQDIQFVVQKLLPSSDGNRTTTALMRMISSTLATGISAGVMLTPSPGAYMGGQMISSMIYQLNNAHEQKVNKKAQIDQGQAISLYSLVRNTAEKVTDRYRDYKFYARRIGRTQESLENLQNMIQDARQGQDAAKQIEMEYTLSKAKGDVEEAVFQARRHRQNLVDLAGAEAVAKLDQAMQDQFLAEKALEKEQEKKEQDDKQQLAEKPTKEQERKREALHKLIEGIETRDPKEGKSPSSNM